MLANTHWTPNELAITAIGMSPGTSNGRIRLSKTSRSTMVTSPADGAHAVEGKLNTDPTELVSSPMDMYTMSSTALAAWRVSVRTNAAAVASRQATHRKNAHSAVVRPAVWISRTYRIDVSSPQLAEFKSDAHIPCHAAESKDIVANASGRCRKLEATSQKQTNQTCPPCQRAAG
jgi:hypothetical protein